MYHSLNIRKSHLLKLSDNFIGGKKCLSAWKLLMMCTSFPKFSFLSENLKLIDHW